MLGTTREEAEAEAGAATGAGADGAEKPVETIPLDNTVTTFAGATTGSTTTEGADWADAALLGGRPRLGLLPSSCTETLQLIIVVITSEQKETFKNN